MAGGEGLQVLVKGVLFVCEEKPKHSRTLNFGTLFNKWSPRFFIWDLKGGITQWKNEQQYLLDQGHPFTIPTQDLVLERTTTAMDDKDKDKQFCFRIGNNRLRVKAPTSQACTDWLDAHERFRRHLSEMKSEWQHEAEESRTDRREYYSVDTEFKDFFTAQSGINPWDHTPLVRRGQRHSVVEVPRANCEFTKGNFQSLLDFVLVNQELHVVLLLNHVLLSSPHALFQSLVDRFFSSDTPRGQKQATLSFLTTWMERFLDDLIGILPSVEGFFMLRMRVSHESGLPDESARAIRASIDIKSLEERKRTLKVLFDHKRANPPKPPTRICGPTLNFLKKFVPEPPDICDFAPRKIAEALTRADFDNFKRIKPRELLNKGWTRNNGVSSPNVAHMIRVFNRRSYWVASQIIGRAQTRQQTRTIWHFINVLQECRSLNNFYATYAILNGLTLTPIHRLQAAWKGLPSVCKSAFTQLKVDLDTSRNFSAYRNAFTKATGIKIPHLAVVCKDLFLLEEIDTVSAGVINWTKLMDCWEIMKKNFFDPQDEPQIKAFDPNPELEMGMHAGFVRVLTEDEIWAQSYKCHPKPATPPT